jgi:glycine cleavage system H protein
MSVPAGLKYTKDHEWAKIEGQVVTVGITDYAQGQLGDVVYLDLPEVGAEVKQDETFGTIEAVKAVSDLFSPVTGIVIEVNSALADQPETVNRDPYAEGWMVKIKLSNPSELDDLLDADGYTGLIG